MATISLCMIVKNEEDVIGRCLESVKDIVDEIIIVDTGSTDQTKKIVSSFTKKIFDFKWVDDFAKARNFSFKKATKEYILWLDADDIFLEEDQKKLSLLKKNLDPSVDSVSMFYNLTMDENGKPVMRLRRNRLVKRSRGFKWIGPVHEYLEVGGHIITSDAAVTHASIHHDSDRNLRIYENRLKQGEKFSPRDLFYFANELKDHQQYERAVEYYEAFLSEGKGWIEDNIAACGKLADCYHELSNQEKMINSVLRSFHYESPRPEFCCRLAYTFFEKMDYHSAIYWYKQAAAIGVSASSWGIQNQAYADWIPHIQLCVCYDRLGDYKMSEYHNEQAGSIRPNNPQYLHNKRYLEQVFALQNKKESHDEQE
ncbi:glycosyltransferase family 2 protein [Bacillus sp. FJAT-42376]|uniref:tetratricopeptide repeat-containing glycosyltransferase family 2 protein n=1 Tax=Bacillus sp. FJAT-42376 TaxID=2014076 RepID=UPI000F4D2F63|nr:glycosyltransferase family 2 protein [Bacillus sp. FJAT-42376]AZB43221.1 glycosyltransferase family 2 protein [Bacillus sp. FJAT-42376]